VNLYNDINCENSISATAYEGSSGEISTSPISQNPNTQIYLRAANGTSLSECVDVGNYTYDATNPTITDFSIIPTSNSDSKTTVSITPSETALIELFGDVNCNVNIGSSFIPMDASSHSLTTSDFCFQSSCDLWARVQDRSLNQSVCTHVGAYTNLDYVTLCGDSGNGCYDNSVATSSGFAKLSDGTLIDYVDTSNGTGFKVWKEQLGSRILFATGLWSSQSDWQKQLNRSGIGAKTDDFTDISKIGGRACPASTFVNYTNMIATDLCLYYDTGSTTQALNAASGIEGEDWIMDGNRPTSGRGASSSWYEGNIQTCANRGMRLPTAYETDAEDQNNFTTQMDAVPTFSGTGVPSYAEQSSPYYPWEFSWTASINPNRTDYYFRWSTYAQFYYSNSYTSPSDSTIRCVLPPTNVDSSAATTTTSSSTTTTTIAAGANGDPYWDNVVLLLHMDGAEGSNSFTDSSALGQSFSPTGSAMITTSDSKTNGASAYFDGTSYIGNASNNSDLTFNGAFTLEAWANFSDVTATGWILHSQKDVGGQPNYIFGLYIYPSRKIKGMMFGYGTYGISGDYFYTNYIPTPNEWHHYAFTRDAFNRWRIFIDGVETPYQIHEENTTIDFAHTISPSSDGVNVGYNMKGYVDELRVTKGIARYTANFTPNGSSLADYPSDTTTTTTTTLAVSNGACSTTCGALGNGCYENATAKTALCATLQDGNEYSGNPTTLEYVKADPTCSSSCFYIWREKDIALNQTARRILNANGIWDSSRDYLQWQQTLQRTGIGYNQTLTEETLITDSAPATKVVSQMGGRTCPTNVFVNFNNMLANYRCVYYDVGNAVQAINKDSGTLAQDYLTTWDLTNTGRDGYSSYYEGNLKTCADKGMRLPTLYETRTRYSRLIINSIPTGDLKINGGTLDNQPQFHGSSNGVPSYGSETWTSTAGTVNNTRYFRWTGTLSYSDKNYSDSYNVRCILP